ncbi:OmpP1/FadL family transporter [Williamwhitmania taraxaci]|uniref:Outer membrane protein transport protein (OMPP1/FadL/TodX) n=1 Tax=Williamwhitmania taraxaci TaxID=1640674 RepID=A0A1G6H2C6_9BACT|nr:hypothetical protein [Williamwhitmania taraxaci]SDB88460.1 hypothetical protein SAMN05216323_100635 [Williamwhitmania taraxaci]
MKHILSVVALLISLNSWGQDISDVYRYSSNVYSGTARFSGMAGSIGALGGDFSAVSINPAGLGVYRSNDFSFTPNLNFNRSNSSYQGQVGSDNTFNLGISNIGLALTFSNPVRQEDIGIVSFNFGIGYNKLRDFNSSVTTSGVDVASITDVFLEATKRVPYADRNSLSKENSPFANYNSSYWGLIMAWNNFIIDADATGYISHLANNDIVFQNRLITTSGSQGEYALSFAGNVADKFYFGGTLGIQDLYYKNKTDYSEAAVDGNTGEFQDLNYKQIFETIGSGYNFKLGMIIKPIHSLRIGVAFHTPTFFNLKDRFSSSMDTHVYDVNTLKGYSMDSPLGEYDYNMVTPYKFVASLGYILLDKIAMNIDYEYVDYTVMRLRSGGQSNSFKAENDQISAMVESSSNYRFGAEYHEGIFFLRGGYAYYGSPYKQGYLNSNSNTQVFAGGVGLRTGTFYTDFTYSKTRFTDENFLYNGSEGVVNDKHSQNQFILTFGYKF